MPVLKHDDDHVARAPAMLLLVLAVHALARTGSGTGGDAFVLAQESAASSSSYSSSGEAERACELRTRHPPEHVHNVRPLTFCNWYRHKSCCLPAHDAEIKGYFLALIGAGEICAKYQNRAKYYLSLTSCYGCDPDEPNHFTQPLDSRFFNATKSVKICASVASHMAPSLFSDCGLLLADDRQTICSPNSAIALEYVWTDCADQQHICQNNASLEWSCSDTHWGEGNTPTGFMDVPCNKSEHTCGGVLKFLNDDRAAKPVNYEAYPVEIIDEEVCMQKHNNDASKCHCLRVPSSTAAAPRSARSKRGFGSILSVVVAVLISALHSL